MAIHQNRHERAGDGKKEYLILSIYFKGERESTYIYVYNRANENKAT